MLGRRKSEGKCWLVSWPLVTYLKMLGHDVEGAEGFVRGEPHVWIKMRGGQIIDPTADQFSTAKTPMPKVYIGVKPSFYREKSLSK